MNTDKAVATSDEDDRSPTTPKSFFGGLNDPLFHLSQTLVASGGNLRSTRSRQLFLETRLPVTIQDNNNNNEEEPPKSPMRRRTRSLVVASPVNEPAEEGVRSSGRRLGSRRRRLDFTDTAVPKQQPEETVKEPISVIQTPGVTDVAPLPGPLYSRPSSLIVLEDSSCSEDEAKLPEYDLDSEDEDFMSSGQWPIDELAFERCMELLLAREPWEGYQEVLGEIRCSEEIKDAIITHYHRKDRSLMAPALRIPVEADVDPRHPYDCFAARSDEKPMIKENKANKTKEQADDSEWVDCSSSETDSSVDCSAFKQGDLVIDESDDEIVLKPPRGFQQYVPTPPRMAEKRRESLKVFARE